MMATSPRRAGAIIFSLIVIFMMGVCVYIMPYQNNTVVVETDYRKVQKSKTYVTATEKVYDSVKEQAFMAAQEKLQDHRKAVLREGCQKYYDQPIRDIARNGIDHNTILVNDKHKLLYCFVPKVACTNWKRVFLVLAGHYGPSEISNITQYTANRSLRKLRTFQSLSEAERTRALQSYTKFVFVRHPFSRLLSAFKNKLSPESTFERADYWRNSIGVQILFKNRQSRYGKPLLNSTQLVNMKHGSGYNLRFEEFISHVGNPEQPLPQNKHWKEVSERCYPCDIDYDIIGKFETLDNDVKYILKRTKVDHLVEFPKPDISSPTNSSNRKTLESYYDEVPLEDMQNVIKRYRLDFSLFGYSPSTQDPDPYLQNVSRHVSEENN